jgi:hypothetical protein
MVEMWIAYAYLNAGLLALASSVVGLGWTAEPPCRPDLAALRLDRMPSSRDELRRAYRLAARAAHPDAGGSREAFLAVSAAFERLSKAVAAQ